MSNREISFIREYVNCVYGIILGFGFIHITTEIFSEDYSEQIILSFSFQILSQLMMALFVIIVICYCWWDWIKIIENQTESTFFDFIIEVVTGFILLLILFSFNNPLVLINLFIILSIFDLGWVINFSKDKDYAKKDRDKWIGQKFLATLIYLIALCAIISLNNLHKYIDFLIGLHPLFSNISYINYMAVIFNYISYNYINYIIVVFSYVVVIIFCFQKRPIDKKNISLTNTIYLINNSNN